MGARVLVVVPPSPPPLDPLSLRRSRTACFLRAGLFEPAAHPNRLRPDRSECNLPPKYPQVPGPCELGRLFAELRPVLRTRRRRCLSDEVDEVLRQLPPRSYYEPSHSTMVPQYRGRCVGLPLGVVLRGGRLVLSVDLRRSRLDSGALLVRLAEQGGARAEELQVAEVGLISRTDGEVRDYWRKVVRRVHPGSSERSDVLDRVGDPCGA